MSTLPHLQFLTSPHSFFRLAALAGVFAMITVLVANAQISPGANNTVYVTPTGGGNGSTWANATSDLQGAIDASGGSGTRKVFVAIGNYNIPAPVVMKNNTEIYGGFDPGGGITELSHARILPNKTGGDGSVLNGGGVRRLVFNGSNGLNNSAVLDGFTLTNGNANQGGAIFNVSSSPTFNNLVIRNNAALEAGGAFYSQESSMKLSNAVVRHNSAPYGGAFYNNNNSNAVITNVSIYDNAATLGTAGAGGGAIFNEDSSPTLINVLLANNFTQFQGGGIRNLSGDPVLRNVTFVNNTAGVNYSAMSIAGGTVHLNNSISFGAITGTYTANHSLIEGNTNFSNGNINPAGIATTDVFTNVPSGNFRLKNGSPAVNAGSSALFTGLSGSSTDMDGNPRVHNFSTGGIIDMGAYESTHSSPIVPDGSGITYVRVGYNGNGSSWAHATGDLQGAINASGTQKVFVAIGKYNAESASFVMKNNVELYGGFDPTDGITNLSHTRIPPRPLTDGGTILDGKNERMVFYNSFSEANPLNPTALLDGFLIQNGRSNTNGGGMHNNYASPTLTNVVIRNNRANQGGGIYSAYSSPVLNNVKLYQNRADVVGGAMYNLHSPNIVMNKGEVYMNRADGYAGGIYNNNSGLELINVDFTQNRADATDPNAGGGAIFNLLSDIRLTNVLLKQNSTNARGGAIRSLSGHPVLTNVTLDVNTAVNDPVSTAIEVAGGNFTLNNSIVLGTIRGAYTANYSLIQGVAGGDNGNVNGVSVVSTDLFNFIGSYDYTLKSTAPAIDAGNNALYPGLDANTKDLGGEVRVYNYAGGGTIDLGAHESPHTLVITPDANGIVYVREGFSGNGSNWATATGRLQRAIDAIGTQKVYVAAGNYNVPDNSNFVMKNGVAIYGGFDPANGIVDLDGDRILPNLGMGDGSVLNGRNVRTPVGNNNNGLDNSAVLDGFTITNGRDAFGGGIYNNNVSPTFNNLVITNNEALTCGGGIYNVNAPIKLNNSIIRNNTAQYGGGIQNAYSASVLTNVAITGNTATMATEGAGGGGIFNDDSELVLVNVLIAGNSTNFQGGGFRNTVGKNPVFTNVTIVGNTAGVDYSAMEIAAGTPQINNSIVFGTIAGNFTPQSSMIDDNTSGARVAATQAITDVFTDPANGNYTLKSGSPAINTGNNNLYPNLDANTRDLAGNPRLVGTTIDQGAYESPDGALPVRWISFEGRLSEQRQAVLTWKTEEINVSRYEAERSADGRNFKVVGAVAAGGTGSGSYSLTDPAPVSGTVYYRIRQVDIDGTFSYSRMIPLTYTGRGKLFVYPNPVKGNLIIELGPEYIGSKVKLVSTAGIVLQQAEVKEEVMTLDVSTYASGIYFLQLYDGKVVKLVRE